MTVLQWANKSFRMLAVSPVTLRITVKEVKLLDDLNHAPFGPTLSFDDTAFDILSNLVNDAPTLEVW